MTVSDYRAFGDCQKTVLTAGQSIDMRNPELITVPGTYTIPTGFKYQHMCVVIAASGTMTIGLRSDIAPANTTTAILLAAGITLVGVNYISVTDGTAVVYLFL